MAAFSGKQGVFTYGSLDNLNTASWSINVSADVTDVSKMDVAAPAAGTHWKGYVGGFKDWTATVECFDDTSGIATLLTELGDSAALGLDTTSGGDYAGTAFLTGFAQSTDASGAATITLNFQGSGALTITV